MTESRRDRLRAELVQLRLRAGVGVREMGAAIGRSQGTVYRIEHGETLPSVKHVTAWLNASDADGPTRARLLDLVAAVHAEVRGWGELLDLDGHAQREAAAQERDAVRIRNFQPTVVPGLLQTPEYARALLSVGRTRDVDAAVAARITRQQVLYEPGRRFEFLITESALRWPIGGPQVLAAQLDRIISLTRVDSVTVAMLPATVTVAAAWHNFILWDGEDGTSVTAELVDGEHDVRDPDRVALYDQLWDRLWAVAAVGAEAVQQAQIRHV